jgi:hypothetical protein
MTKGVHSGKQEKKAARHQTHAKPELIEEKDESERKAEDTTRTTEQTQTKIETEPPRRTEKKSRRERFLEWANKWSNVLLVVVPSVFSFLVLAAILLQAYIYEKQWNSMQASIDETRRNREIEYRAYVVVKSAGIVPQQNLPLGAITITTFNSGRTPGVGKIKAIFRPLKDSPPEDFPVEINEEQSRIIFAPLVDVSTRVSLIPVEQPNSIPSPSTAQPKPKTSPPPAPPAAPAIPADMQIAAPDRWEYYVFGYIEYTDIFYKTHWTKFCVYNVPGTPHWTYCPTFNDAN